MKDPSKPAPRSSVGVDLFRLRSWKALLMRRDTLVHCKCHSATGSGLPPVHYQFGGWLRRTRHPQARKTSLTRAITLTTYAPSLSR